MLFEGCHTGSLFSRGSIQCDRGFVCMEPLRFYRASIWVVVKIMVLFWVLITVRHLIFRVPKRGHNLDNYPYGFESNLRAQGLRCEVSRVCANSREARNNSEMLPLASRNSTP